MPTMDSKYLYSEKNITLLIANVFRFVINNNLPPYIVDFMNCARRLKLDIRLGLYNTILTVNKKIDENEMTLEKSKILVHKNPEGIELKEQDFLDMARATFEDPKLMILYAIDTSITLRNGETFKDMKNRYRLENKSKWAMYSRDDYMVNLIHSCMLGVSICSPVIYSNDMYRDTDKYRHIEPFYVWMFVKGRMYKFLLDYDNIEYWILVGMVKKTETPLLCNGSVECINCSGMICLKCYQCIRCRQM